MKFSVIIQARTGSSRLPNKVMKNYKKFNILDILVSRIKKSKLIDKIIISTTNKKKDIKIINFCKKKKILFFKGSEKNVLKRYYDTACKFKLKYIIRLTSDCPLIDLHTMEEMIKKFRKYKIDFYSNTVPHPCKFPDGSDIEIFNFKTLKRTYSEAILPSDKEHVTFYMWKYGKFKIKKFNIKKDLSSYRYTVDYPEDFKLICSMIDYFGNKIIDLKMKDIIKFIDDNPRLILYQRNIFRTIGWQKSLEKDKKFKKKYQIK
jgi:spore coat polysaccharide biosynthesis protein SpsF (cytidylyltransferase family)